MTTGEILPKEVTGTLGHLIKPGDKVFTFTQAYGTGTRVSRGIYLGVKIVPHRYNRGETREQYVVEREDGKKTYLNFRGMVPQGTSLDELHDKVI